MRRKLQSGIQNYIITHTRDSFLLNHNPFAILRLYPVTAKSSEDFPPHFLRFAYYVIYPRNLTGIKTECEAHTHCVALRVKLHIAYI